MSNFFPDRLNAVDPKRVGLAAFSCIDRLQRFTPEQQVAAAAIVLQLQCRRFNAHVGTVLNVANNVIDRTIHETPQLGAVREYVKHEL